MKSTISALLAAAAAAVGWGLYRPNAVRSADAPPDQVKGLVDAINRLRTDPGSVGEAVTKMLAQQDPNYESTDTFAKDDINGKTRLQHLAAFKTAYGEGEKLSPLEWDADLAAIAEREGKSANKLFAPEVSAGGGGKPSERVLMWLAIDGHHTTIAMLRKAGLKYIGVFKKPGENDDYQLVASSLPGKAYQLKEDEFAGRPYDPREDNSAPWSDALSLKQPNITSFVKADGTLDVAWRDMGSPPKVHITRFSAGGERQWTKEVPGVNPADHPLLAGFTEDPKGNIYVMRAKDEGYTDKAVEPKTPKNDKGEPDHNYDRSEMMRLTKLDSEGNEVWTKDLAKKGGGASAFFSPLSPGSELSAPGRRAGHDHHASTSRIGFTTIHSRVYRLASDEAVIVPPAVAELCLIGRSFDGKGHPGEARFAEKWVADEADGVYSPKVKLSFKAKFSEGVVEQPVGDNKPAEFDDGNATIFSDLNFPADVYAKFIEFLDKNKQGEDGNFHIAGDKLKVKAASVETPIIFCLYGAATDYDHSDEFKSRHQNAYWRTANADTGDPVTDLNGAAMAHSFDSQLLVTDEGVITVERMDGGLLMGNYLKTRPSPLIFLPFYSCHGLGNNCFTQVGSLTKADDGYLFLMAGNHSKATVSTEVRDEAFAEEHTRNRDLLVMRIKKGFAQAIDGIKDEKVLATALASTKHSKEVDEQIALGRTYITDYLSEGKYSASRPKMVRLNEGGYIVIWERWTHTVSADKKEISGHFDSTWAMKISQDGETLKPAVKLSDSVRITRGDEPVLWNGKAAFLAGDVVENKMVIHTVDGDLNHKVTALPLH